MSKWWREWSCRWLRGGHVIKARVRHVNDFPIVPTMLIAFYCDRCRKELEPEK